MPKTPDSIVKLCVLVGSAIDWGYKVANDPKLKYFDANADYQKHFAELVEILENYERKEYRSIDDGYDNYG